MYRLARSLAVLLLMSGCSRNVAVLYIKSDPPGAQVISTYDGQHLDDGTGTPTEVIFHRDNFPYPSDFIGLYISEDCYRPVFQFVKIDRWHSSLEEARLGANNVNPRLSAMPNCTLRKPG